MPAGETSDDLTTTAEISLLPGMISSSKWSGDLVGEKNWRLALAL